MEYKKYRAIELLFENTQSIIIPQNLVKVSVFSDIKTSANSPYKRTRGTGKFDRLYFRNHAAFAMIGLDKTAGDLVIPSLLDEPGNETLRQRLSKIDDICSITFHLLNSEWFINYPDLPDSQCARYTITPEWNFDRSDEFNDYQHTFVIEDNDFIIMWCKLPEETINYHFTTPYGLFPHIRNTTYNEIIQFASHTGFL